MAQKLLTSFKKTDSPVAYCILSIGMGTRNENPKFNGLAHLTEHMLFKGTSNRSSTSINRVLEAGGGDLNAFTTKERIVLISTTLKEDIKRAVELLFELVFDSQFPPDELVKEKKVVYDEIISYQDSPTALLFDTFEGSLLEHTPLGNPILGDKKTLEPITSEILKRNLAKFFRPDNMTFVVAGDFAEDYIKSLIERSLQRWRPDARLSFVPSDTEGSLQRGGTDLFVPVTSREFLQKEFGITDGVKFNRQVDKNLKQAHCIIGTTSYSYYDRSRRAALSLIANILGGPSLGSRLNLILREKHAMVYHVEASCSSYKDIGMFCIYFGCDKKYLERCIDLIKKELRRLTDTTLSNRTLVAAKKQMIGQLSIASDSESSIALTIGKSLLLSGRSLSISDIRADIEAVTAEDLRRVACEILPWERMSSLVFY